MPETYSSTCSSVPGNYSYAEVNMNLLGAPRHVLNAFRLAVLASVGMGSVLALSAGWAFADVAMALMALVNLTAILLLGKWAWAALLTIGARSMAVRIRLSWQGPCRDGIWGSGRSSEVGMTGFEPATLRSQSGCATKLRYIP